ncbi:MAG TPA: fatty acid desaturase, partial [Pirellulales bacterium]|nr:fatty acid desaturase [Pirellulales bacterium]
MKSAVSFSAAPLGFARLLLRDPADAPLVLLAAAHGVVIWFWPCALAVSVGTWWNLNTIAHNFIHRPFFRSPVWNRWFSLYLTALLGVPQTLWRERHLAHHGNRSWRPRLSRPLALESVVVSATWGTMIVLRPEFWCGSY